MRRSRAPLVLMEQLVMILVFALAAAVCIRAFAAADHISHVHLETDRAVAAAEDAAETIKACSGDLSAAQGILGGTVSGETWFLCYDENWNAASEEDGAYRLSVSPWEQLGKLPTGLGKATVRVERTDADAAGETLFEIPVSWQEVSAGE